MGSHFHAAFEVAMLGTCCRTSQICDLSRAAMPRRNGVALLRIVLCIDVLLARTPGLAA
jgi:hypothetical protein